MTGRTGKQNVLPAGIDVTRLTENPAIAAGEG